MKMKTIGCLLDLPMQRCLKYLLFCIWSYLHAECLLLLHFQIDTYCPVQPICRAELIRFVCCIDNVQQSFRIRVNIVPVTGEVDGLHHLISCQTCSESNKFRRNVLRKRQTQMVTYYRSGTVNSNTVNSKFHLIRSYCKYLAKILSFHF